MTATMRAVLSGRGPDWGIAEVPVPEPAANEVLIRVSAVATNNADLPMLREADPDAGGHGREFVAGYEYAGDVVGIGAGVTAWQVGDLVMGSVPSSFAEYVVADQRFVLPRPESVAPEIACALPTGLLTEHGALTRAGFASGQSVLITGASSGIGLIGVQLAKALGASRVIATTRSPHQRELISSLGADVVLDGEMDLAGQVMAVTDGRGADLCPGSRCGRGVCPMPARGRGGWARGQHRPSGGPRGHDRHRQSGPTATSLCTASPSGSAVTRRWRA